MRVERKSALGVGDYYEILPVLPVVSKPMC
jgi:hypothetical protein